MPASRGTNGSFPVLLACNALAASFRVSLHKRVSDLRSTSGNASRVHGWQNSCWLPCAVVKSSHSPAGEPDFANRYGHEHQKAGLEASYLFALSL